MLNWLACFLHTQKEMKMSTDKKFAVAGVSTLEGKTKLRFANDTMRIKILAKNGHTDVELVELPVEMTKAEAVQHLKSIEFGKGNTAIEGANCIRREKEPCSPSRGKGYCREVQQK